MSEPPGTGRSGSSPSGTHAVSSRVVSSRIVSVYTHLTWYSTPSLLSTTSITWVGSAASASEKSIPGASLNYVERGQRPGIELTCDSDVASEPKWVVS